MQVYLDNNATTVVSPEVWDAMRICKEIPLNPSSVHQYGQKARSLLESSREAISRILDVPASDLFFTSCATEAVNTLIRGFTRKGARIITTRAEHSCIHETVLDLQKQGTEVHYLPIQPSGAVCLHLLTKALEDAQSWQKTLVILGSVHSETGVLLQLQQVAHLCETYGAHFLVDAVAHVGKESLVVYPGISAMCFSAHKFHGPKGIGFFYAKPEFAFSPLLLGGPQENHKRAGTENVEGVLGLTKAFTIAHENLVKNQKHMQDLRDYFEKRLNESGVHFRINGAAPRVCNISNLCFPNVDGEALLIDLDQQNVFASMGSACASGSVIRSRTLAEMGLAAKDILSSLRFSFSKYNTKKEVDYAVECIQKSCELLKH